MFLLYKQTKHSTTGLVINVEMLRLGTKEECIEALREHYYKDNCTRILEETVENAFEEGALYFNITHCDYYKIREV